MFVQGECRATLGDRHCPELVTWWFQVGINKKMKNTNKQNGVADDYFFGILSLFVLCILRDYDLLTPLHDLEISDSLMSASLLREILILVFHATSHTYCLFLSDWSDNHVFYPPVPTAQDIYLLLFSHSLQIRLIQTHAQGNARKTSNIFAKSGCLRVSERPE